MRKKALRSLQPVWMKAHRKMLILQRIAVALEAIVAQTWEDEKGEYRGAEEEEVPCPECECSIVGAFLRGVCPACGRMPT